MHECHTSKPEREHCREKRINMSKENQLQEMKEIPLNHRNRDAEINEGYTMTPCTPTPGRYLIMTQLMYVNVFIFIRVLTEYSKLMNYINTHMPIFSVTIVSSILAHSSHIYVQYFVTSFAFWGIEFCISVLFLFVGAN